MASPLPRARSVAAWALVPWLVAYDYRRRYVSAITRLAASEHRARQLEDKVRQLTAALAEVDPLEAMFKAPAAEVER